MNKILIIVIAVCTLSGCATTSSSNLACDFIDGAADNVVTRNEDKDKSTIHGDRVQSSQNNDIEAGVLSLISGAFTRFMNSDDSSECL